MAGLKTITTEGNVFKMQLNLEEAAGDRMDRLFNYMKISEMSRYGSPVFSAALDQYMSVLSEADFETLVTSYWCCKQHFISIIRRRGQHIKGGALRLRITQSLLSQAIDGGNVDKIKAMFLCREHDVGNAFIFEKQKRTFLLRDCRRFWDHELPLKAYAEVGWLTPAFATIGLARFSKYMRTRITPDQQRPWIRMQGCSNGSPSMLQKWANLVELLASMGACVPPVFNESNIPLSVMRAFIAGHNTRLFKLLPSGEKNGILFTSVGFELPEDLWEMLACFL